MEGEVQAGVGLCSRASRCRAGGAGGAERPPAGAAQRAAAEGTHRLAPPHAFSRTTEAPSPTKRRLTLK